MNKNDNEVNVVFIMDRSGSMRGKEEIVIKEYNRMIEKQKKQSGNVFITTVLFDDEYKILTYMEKLENIQPITDEEYYVCGCTALLDAVGKTIYKIENSLSKKIPENDVMFVICADGKENSSRIFSYDKIKNIIQKRKEKYGWKFMFFGTEPEVVSAAEYNGIDNAAVYYPDKTGIKLVYSVINDAISRFRKGRELRNEWDIKLKTDYYERIE